MKVEIKDESLLLFIKRETVIVEIKNESILCFIKKPRETMNLLEVLAVANGTLYLLRFATLRRECVWVGRELRR